MRKAYFLAFLFCLLIMTHSGTAQTQGVLGKKFFSNWSVSVSGGTNIFFGDLKVNKFFPATHNMNEYRYAGSFSLIRQISHVFAIRGQLLYGEIAGTKRNYKDGAPANLYFEGNIFEYNLNATINFTNLFFKYKPERKFFIYGTLGAGFSNWITKKKDLNTHQQIGGSGSPSNWTTEIVIPAGLGAYYSFADKVNLGVEWTLRGLNSDKLDATVGGYPYDMYSLLSLNLTFNFNKRNSGKLKPAQYSTPQGILLPKPPVNEIPPEVLEKAAREKNSTESVAITPPPPLNEVTTPGSAIQKNIISPPVTSEIEGDETFSLNDQGITYRVQVFASHDPSHTPESIQQSLRLSMPVDKEFSENWYRFTIGPFNSWKAAEVLMKKLKALGLKGVFIVRYADGRRIPPGTKK